MRLVRSVLVSIAVVGCACTPRVKHPLPVVVRAAPDLTLRRLEAGHVALAHASAYWPGFGDTPVPEVLVFDQTGQWLLGDDGSELAGYAPTGQTFSRNPVFYTEPSIWLTSETIKYRPQGFPPGQTVYRARRDHGYLRKSPMYLVESLEAIRARGRKMTSEAWLALMLHEIFHIFQKTSVAVRAFGAESGMEVEDRTKIDTFVEELPAYRALLAKEADLLDNAAPSTPLAARATLRQWLALRNARVASMRETFRRAEKPHADLDAIDAYYTFAEGTARYVEMRYLNDPESHHDPLLRDDPMSLQYAPDGAERSVRMTVSESGLGKDYFYHLGDMLSRLLDVATPAWKSEVMDRRRLLIGQIEALP